MPKKLKHKDTGDTDTQTTQAQSTDGQGTEAPAAAIWPCTPGA